MSWYYPEQLVLTLTLSRHTHPGCAGTTTPQTAVRDDENAVGVNTNQKQIERGASTARCSLDGYWSAGVATAWSAAAAHEKLHDHV